MTIVLYFGAKRKADWDNFHKLSMDALTGIVYLDDSQVVKATVTKRYDKQRLRIEINHAMLVHEFPVTTLTKAKTKSTTQMPRNDPASPTRV